MNEEFMGKKQAGNTIGRVGLSAAMGRNRNLTPWATEAYAPAVSPEAQPRTDPQIEHRFIAAVESAMEGPLLRYSKRLELMNLAEKLGIGRFQANLLIAQAQQRTGRADEILVTTPLQEKSHSETSELTWRDRLFIFAALLIIAAIAALVLIRFVLTK